MAGLRSGAGQEIAPPDRLIRHRLTDRLFHWVMAASVVVLLATGFLPILGYRFDWVPIHWITGLVLTAATLFHIVRASVWQRLGSIFPGPRDAADAWRIATGAFGRRAGPPPRQGKYSVAQKLYHLAVTILVLVLVGTGLLMLAKIDTQLWQRNPYFLPSYSWGVVYILHGYAAMALITLIIIHVYFAFRPEKLFFTRSMILGWITRREYRQTFDATRWAIEPEVSSGNAGPAPVRGPAE